MWLATQSPLILWGREAAVLLVLSDRLISLQTGFSVSYLCQKLNTDSVYFWAKKLIILNLCEFARISHEIRYREIIDELNQAQEWVRIFHGHSQKEYQER